jgi:hypothetical protein
MLPSAEKWHSLNRPPELLSLRVAIGLSRLVKPALLVAHAVDARIEKSHCAAHRRAGAEGCAHGAVGVLALRASLRER